MNEGLVTSAAMSTKAVATRKRGCRHSRPVVVKFLPAVEFTVPIFFEFESESYPALDAAV
jgi:hypothetical protein